MRPPFVFWCSASFVCPLFFYSSEFSSFFPPVFFCCFKLFGQCVRWKDYQVLCWSNARDMAHHAIEISFPLERGEKADVKNNNKKKKKGKVVGVHPVELFSSAIDSIRRIFSVSKEKKYLLLVKTGPRRQIRTETISDIPMSVYWAVQQYSRCRPHCIFLHDSLWSLKFPLI